MSEQTPSVGGSAVRDDAPPRASVTVVAGLRSEVTASVVTGLRGADPTVAVIQHDLSQVAAGKVRRVVRTRDRIEEDETVELVHGCVSCTLREDVLPTMVRLGRADPSRPLVLALPDVVEPAAVAGACAHCLVNGEPVTRWVRIDGYVTVVDGATVLEDLDSSDDLSDRGIEAAPADERGVAEVLARQIEFASTVVLWETPDQDPYERAQRRALVQRLAPWARQVAAAPDAPPDWRCLLGRAPDGPDPDELPEPAARGLEGYSLGWDDPEGECAVASVAFRSRRPMHPQRLHDALPRLVGQTLRSRGHLWLATDPRQVVAWESAGPAMMLGGMGQWLAAVSDEQWQEASLTRQAAAALDWHPYYGDRGNYLVFVGIDIDPTRLRAELAACLLTDDELAQGEQVWRTWPDPLSPAE